MPVARSPSRRCRVTAGRVTTAHPGPAWPTAGPSPVAAPVPLPPRPAVTQPSSTAQTVPWSHPSRHVQPVARGSGPPTSSLRAPPRSILFFLPARSPSSAPPARRPRRPPPLLAHLLAARSGRSPSTPRRACSGSLSPTHGGGDNARSPAPLGRWGCTGSTVRRTGWRSVARLGSRPNADGPCRWRRRGTELGPPDASRWSVARSDRTLLPDPAANGLGRSVRVVSAMDLSLSMHVLGGAMCVLVNVRSGADRRPGRPVGQSGANGSHCHPPCVTRRGEEGRSGQGIHGGSPAGDWVALCPLGLALRSAVPVAWQFGEGSIAARESLARAAQPRGPRRGPRPRRAALARRSSALVANRSSSRRRGRRRRDASSALVATGSRSRRRGRRRRDAPQPWSRTGSQLETARAAPARRSSALVANRLQVDRPHLARPPASVRTSARGMASAVNRSMTATSPA